MTATRDADAWVWFEARLGAMRVGDVMTVDQIVTETGIDAETAERVLETLVRAE